MNIMNIQTQVRYRRSGFTLIELMVSVVVLIILLGIVGMVYKSASDAVSQSNARTEIYQKADVFKRQLEHDLTGLTKTGVLVIGRRDFANLTETEPGGKVRWDSLSGRADELFFVSAGLFKSRVDTTTPAISNMALMFYSHGIISANEYGETPADGSNVNRWAWTRQVGLYIPGYSADIDLDVISISTGEYMKNLSQNPGVYINAMFSAPPTVTGGGDSHIVLLMCGPVRIRFQLPTEDYNHNGVLDAEEQDGYNNWPPDNGDGNLDEHVWLEPEAGNYVPFLPASDLKPEALEFTVRLYDRNLSVSSRDDTLGIEHGGLTFRFVVPLPD